jgi:hemerythrin superfamily protein
LFIIENWQFLMEVIYIQNQNEKLRNNSRPTTIYSVLKKEHKEVKAMFEEILDNEEPSKDIFFQIMNALQPHMNGEEQYFYPAIKKASQECNFIVNEAFEEHKWAKKLADEICKITENDEMWLPKVKVLRDMIDHHIEEEESEVFKAAKKLLSTNQQQQILNLYEQGKTKTTKNPK